MPVTVGGPLPEPAAQAAAPERLSVELLTSPWASVFYRLAEQTQHELLIASPFLGAAPIDRLSRILADPGRASTPRLHLLTNLSVDSLLSGSLDVAALCRLAERVAMSRITYLPSLHAKVYVFDLNSAIITSGNLTQGGLAINREYGVILRDHDLVRSVRDDVLRYAALGSDVNADALAAVADAVGRAAVVRQQVDQGVSEALRSLLRQRTEEAEVELLKARAQGKTTHGIFCDTILYLLAERGPLTTRELHPLVQRIHPDVCDDSLDRVIGDVHFGKKWKHYVRISQVGLRRRGLIARQDDGRWALADAGAAAEAL